MSTNISFLNPNSHVINHTTSPSKISSQQLSQRHPKSHETQNNNEDILIRADTLDSKKCGKRGSSSFPQATHQATTPARRLPIHTDKEGGQTNDH